MIAIIAPARLASTRFPEKLLHPINGKPLILWMAERVVQEAPEHPLYFAVDDVKVESVLIRGGFKTVMTKKQHASGTDRLAEANEKIGADVVINVQADEPLVSGEQIYALKRIVEKDVDMATLATPFSSREDFLDPNQVKVIMSKKGEALYFSRAPIPYNRDRFETFDDFWVSSSPLYRHLGMYAYKADFLREFCKLPQGRLEQIEKLEQLRALENGYRIGIELTDKPSIGIDTEEDVRAFEAYLARNG